MLNALEENGLADNTLVFLTTDHGLAFPDAKCTMYDRGIGVMLADAGTLVGFERGRVHDALVSQLDLYPTICDLPGWSTRRGSRARRCSRWCAATSPSSTRRSSPR